MVERVPLADQAIRDAVSEIEAALTDQSYQGRVAAAGLCRTYADAVIPKLIAELRASRAREQELQQRIDKALAMCEAADTDLTPRLMYVELLDPRAVRTALTGTEPNTAPLD